jgi:nitrogen regulatory protein P-II 2
MATVTLKLVTIVAERILENDIVEDILRLGARGYTVTQATGRGSRGVRAHEWEGPDVKVEAVVSPEVAQRIVEHVAERYFAHYAVIVYVYDVDVVRGDKYV